MKTQRKSQRIIKEVIHRFQLLINEQGVDIVKSEGSIMQHSSHIELCFPYLHSRLQLTVDEWIEFRDAVDAIVKKSKEPSQTSAD